jgi:cell wall-associated NlpC family hydrolase
MRRRALTLVLTVTAALAALTGLLTGQAHAATGSLGARVLAEAQTRAGDWYVYGADGPTVFDCSGLVAWASHQLGVNMPRDTAEMLSTGVADGLLVPTRHPVAGSLAFFGTGHVEIVARGHDRTFGALNTGTRVGYHQWNAYWRPSAFFNIA